MVKNPHANAGGIRDTGSIPGLGRSPGEGRGNPLQYSCLENSMDRGAWRAIVHRIAKSRIGEGNGNPLQYSCLENPMDRGAWRATVHRVVKSQVQLSVHTQTHTHTGRDRDCRAPGSSVHAILQARILEWVAISSSRRSSQPRD